MWKRKELKEAARDVVRSNYWETVFAYVLLQVIIVVMVLIARSLPLVLTSVVIYILGVAPMAVGYSKYALNNSEGRASVRDVFFAWRDHYGNIVWCMFVASLEVMAFSCLLIVPGVVKAYELRQVPFILAEDPSTERTEAFRRSREMMSGEKYKAWVLDLSFLGWMVLSVVTGGVTGIFWSNAYWHQTAAELYRALQEKLEEQNELVEIGDSADEELGAYVPLEEAEEKPEEESEDKPEEETASKPEEESEDKPEEETASKPEEESEDKPEKEMTSKPEEESEDKPEEETAGKPGPESSPAGEEKR